MARGNNAQIRTKEATVIVLQKRQETFLRAKREVDEESNSFIVDDVSSYEHAHYDNPSTSYSIQKEDNNPLDFIYSNLSSAICLPEFPTKQPKRPKKRKVSVSTSDYASESGFNSESSDEGEGIDGICDQSMPSIPPAYTNKNNIFSSLSKGIILENIRSTPLTMSEYMRRSTFMRFTANERKLLERQYRGYLISQLDEKIDTSENIALNDEKVQERLNIYEKLPVLNCMACEKAGKSGVSRASTPLIPNDKEMNGCGRKHVETRPHMKYSTILSDPLASKVHFNNPLFRKAVARLPDLRLLGHNASKLAPVVIPKYKRVSRQPPIVHLCDELYGTYEYAVRKEKVDPYSKIIRPLIFCRTLYSPESFKHQSTILQRRIENCEGHFYKSRRKRSTSESPPYSKVGAVSPFGSFRIRSSRSLSPNRRRHPELEEPVAVRSPYQCHGEAVNKEKGKKKPINTPPKFMLCIQSNGSYGAFFYFEKTEQALLMPTRPSSMNTCRFRKMNFENEINHFSVYEFTVIETEMFEYLAKLRFMNSDNRCIELRPETKFGAVLPRRIIFNYLRLIRKPPKPITWQKKSPKKGVAPCLSTTSSGYGSGTSSSRSSVVNANTSVPITLIDILKWLGFYCVMLDEKKARFVLLGAFGGYEYPPLRMTNLLELCQFTFENGGVFCQDTSMAWAQKSQKIQHLVSFQMNAKTKEKSLFNTIAIPISNKRDPSKAASLTCYKLETSFKMFELYELNACLEKVR
uniref:Uncharacterized protein n=1 Tax=Panagrolaimus davidi TaxID=227884 RepID=A0A914R646_9BILA